MTHPEDPKDEESSGQFLVYVDKICSLAMAVGIGCVLCTYLNPGATVAWITVGVAVAIKVVFYAL